MYWRTCSNAVQQTMKLKTIIFTLAAGGLFILSTESKGQSVITTTVTSTTDSLTIKKLEKEDDANRMASAKEAQQDTKTKAKEAKRVQQDADDAAKQAKDALKAEQRAQRSRKSADAQSKKALEARTKSNEN